MKIPDKMIVGETEELLKWAIDEEAAGNIRKSGKLIKVMVEMLIKKYL